MSQECIAIIYYYHRAPLSPLYLVPGLPTPSPALSRLLLGGLCTATKLGKFQLSTKQGSWDLLFFSV